MPARSWPHRRRLCSAAITLALATPALQSLAASRPASGAATAPYRLASIAVTNCNDSGAGSLRDAIAEAVSGGTIDLSGLACSTITLTSGALEIPQDDLYLKYSGEGAALPIIDGNHLSRVLHHTGTGTLRLVGIAIDNGKYDNSNAYQLVHATGGCIYSAGSVYLAASTVSGCTARDTRGVDASGGGIYAAGAVTLFHSSVSGNTATSTAQAGAGGGVATRSAVDVQYSTVSGNTASGVDSLSEGGGISVVGPIGSSSSMTHSTLAANRADRGGALLVSGAGNGGAALVIADSTLSGNAATAYAALYARGPLSVLNSTIAFNTSTRGPAVLIASLLYAVEIQSSIVADNASASGDYDIGDQGNAVVIAGANNLVMVSDGVLLPSDTLTIDPMLGPLADNGGPTLTHAPGSGSPVIDTGNNAAALDNDQRGPGYPRGLDATVDIGACEHATNADAIFVDGFDG